MLSNIDSVAIKAGPEPEPSPQALQICGVLQGPQTGIVCRMAGRCFIVTCPPMYADAAKGLFDFLADAIKPHVPSNMN